jgi:hypothetical protein
MVVRLAYLLELQTHYVRFVRQTEQLLVGYAAAQAPTFFSFGNNDVLGYATTGGWIQSITPSAGPAGWDALLLW